MPCPYAPVRGHRDAAARAACPVCGNSPQAQRTKAVAPPSATARGAHLPQEVIRGATIELTRNTSRVKRANLVDCIIKVPRGVNPSFENCSLRNVEIRGNSETSIIVTSSDFTDVMTTAHDVDFYESSIARLEHHGEEVRLTGRSTAESIRAPEGSIKSDDSKLTDATARFVTATSAGSATAVACTTFVVSGNVRASDVDVDEKASLSGGWVTRLNADVIGIYGDYSEQARGVIESHARTGWEVIVPPLSHDYDGEDTRIPVGEAIFDGSPRQQGSRLIDRFPESRNPRIDLNDRDYIGLSAAIAPYVARNDDLHLDGRNERAIQMFVESHGLDLPSGEARDLAMRLALAVHRND